MVYGIAKLYGYVEEIGYKAWISQDIAKALGIKTGDGVRLESKSGASSARVAGLRDDIKAGVVLTLDVYMAVSGFRTVLVKKLSRVFDADTIALGVESAEPLDVDQLITTINVIVAFRVPVFTHFAGYVQTESGKWVKIAVKNVTPREPSYISKTTKIHIV